MSGTRIPDNGAERPNLPSRSVLSLNKFTTEFHGENEKNHSSKLSVGQQSSKLSVGQQSSVVKYSQTVPIETPQTLIAREVFKQTAANMGFPKDTLSTVILAFARFFSISMSPELLGSLRRESLASHKTKSPGTAKEKAAMEAKVLARIAALDKGVVLGPEALERYAGFLAPEAKNSEKKESKDQEEVPSAEELQAIAEEEAGGDGLLDFLNLLPGKDGQHWMVFPFTINVRGTELRVFLRIFNTDALSDGEGERLIADVTGPKRQWRFLLGKVAGKYRADIQVYPELTARALKHLLREAERFLGEDGLFEEIVVRNGQETASWAEELCDEHLPYINKEV